MITKSFVIFYKGWKKGGKAESNWMYDKMTWSVLVLMHATYRVINDDSSVVTVSDLLGMLQCKRPIDSQKDDVAFSGLVDVEKFYLDTAIHVGIDFLSGTSFAAKNP